MNPECVGDSARLKRRCWEVAAEAVRKGEAAPEQLLKMLTVEVGHTDSEVIYRENKLAVHHYEPAERRHETPIFVVYALINRPYILDLQPDRSVVRRLLEAGFDVYLVDWGEPSRLDADLSLTDYVCRYLDNCVEAVRDHADVADVHLVGYCMGGTMAAMYAARNQAPVRTLTCMATPYAFDGDAGILERWAEYFEADVAVEAMGTVSGDWLAVEFSLMDPVEHYLGKYVRLYDNVEDDAFVTNFARMERWIWDGVDVAGETFREFVDELYRENRLVAGEFALDSEPVDLSVVEVPVLLIVGEHDHIVPPESTLPLRDAVSSEDTRVVEFSAGHIGISVSRSAHERLWPAVADWFAARSEAAGVAAGDTPVATTDEPTPGTALEPAETDGDRERAKATVESVARRAAAQTIAQRRATGAGGVGESAGDAGAATVEAGADAGDAGGGAGSAPVEAVDGIGPTYADRLAAAGIETVADLRTRDADELAEIADAPPGRVEHWLDQVS